MLRQLRFPKVLLTLLPALICVEAYTSLAQIKEPWVRYSKKSASLYGYKDLQGLTMITAKFGLLPPADTFHNIIAVEEKAGNTYPGYYLLKDGRMVGQDSVYMFDFTYDCEQEGKIIFYDKKTDRVGFLDSNGSVTIPAVYNYVSPFHNGISIARINARRWCWDNNSESEKGCEHLGWKCGDIVLINAQNEVLVDSFNYNPEKINWYTCIINDTTVDSRLYTSFSGRNNTMYSFVDFEKEFQRWFYREFVPAAQQDNNMLAGLLFSEITYWSEKKGWVSISGNQFLRKFGALFSHTLFENGKIKEVSITEGIFNEYIFTKQRYNKYKTSCGAHDNSRFPMYMITLNHYKKPQKLPVTGTSEIDYQDHFEFLKTDAGYRLLSVSMKHMR